MIPYFSYSISIGFVYPLIILNSYPPDIQIRSQVRLISISVYKLIVLFLLLSSLFQSHPFTLLHNFVFKLQVFLPKET